MNSLLKPATGLPTPLLFIGVTNLQPRLTFEGLGSDAEKRDTDFRAGLTGPVGLNDGCS